MDGVIVDSHPIHMKAWRKLLDSLGRATSEMELDILRDGKTKAEILQYFIGDTSPQQISTYSVEKDRIYREEAKELRPLKGLRHLLDQLRLSGIPSAVASSGSSWRVDETLHMLGLRDYFAVIITGTEFPQGKNDSMMFINAAERMHVEYKDVLVFEDSVAGTRASTLLGMKCLGIGDGPRANTLVAAGADRVYEDFEGMSLSNLQLLFADGSDSTEATASCALSH